MSVTPPNDPNQSGHEYGHTPAQTSENQSYGSQPAYGQQIPYGSQPGFNNQSFNSQPTAQHKSSEPNFFKALFDLNFRHFITVKFSKYIYILSMVGIAFWALLTAIIVGTDSAGLGILTFIVMLIFGFIMLIFVRLSLELYVAVIRIAENSSQIHDELTKK